MKGIFQIRQTMGRRTVAFPPKENPLPERFRGLPLLAPERCQAGCSACTEVCPTGAVSLEEGLHVDLGQCLFCPLCEEACPSGALRFGKDFALSASQREDLSIGEGKRPNVRALEIELRRLLGRSLKLRQVSAGGCNGCEAEMNASSNVVFDLGRFGVQFVASPRHADGMVVTGPVTRNMERALRETFAAIPEPKLVILVGACAISGGIFEGSPAVAGMPAGIPVDLYVPGCPPHPLTFLDGLLGLFGRRRG
jgi:Ni,Fe-hydrogenase III small subunit/NAD-dependent dihydropyrimidine dehydrogenase PreA subunit